MPNHLRGLMERSADMTSEMGQPIRFIASREGVKRDGWDIRASGWELSNYLANPTVLWSHDYVGERPPIGRAERVWIDGDRLMADVVFDQTDAFATAIESKYRNGFLNTVSVGWDTLETEGQTITKAELLDISAVNIPGDPGALMERQVRALRTIGQALLDATNDTESDEPTGIEAQTQWEGTALRMLRLFTTGVEDGIDTRTYKRLEREYRRLGRTAPEIPDHLAALDIETIRGLFVEGEPDLVPEVFGLPDESGKDAWASWLS